MNSPNTPLSWLQKSLLQKFVVARLPKRVVGLTVSNPPRFGCCVMSLNVEPLRPLRQVLLPDPRPPLLPCSPRVLQHWPRSGPGADDSCLVGCWVGCCTNHASRCVAHCGHFLQTPDQGTCPSAVRRTVPASRLAAHCGRYQPAIRGAFGR